MAFLPFNLLGALPDILMGRDPKEALFGNAASVTGALAMPGLLNAGAAPATQQGMLAAQESGIGPLGTMGWKGATTGMQGAMNGMGGLLGSAEKIAKPVGIAMDTARMFQPDEPMQMPPPPPMLPPTTSPTLGQIVQGNMENSMAQQQMDERKRNMRKQRIGLIGGGYA